MVETKCSRAPRVTFQAHRAVTCTFTLHSRVLRTVLAGARHAFFFRQKTLTNCQMHRSTHFRRILVGLVGLAAVATVLLPSGYLQPAVAATAATRDCTMDMSEMQMSMPMECGSP